MPPVITATAAMDIAGPSQQPFQCSICLKRFTRHENLKRHSTLHTSNESTSSYPCDFCTTCFARQDLRRRHIKYKHPEVDISLYTTGSGSRRRANRASSSTSPGESSAPPQQQQQQQMQGQGSNGAGPSMASASGPMGFEMPVNNWDFEMFDQGMNNNGPSMSTSLWSGTSDLSTSSHAASLPTGITRTNFSDLRMTNNAPQSSSFSNWKHPFDSAPCSSNAPPLPPPAAVPTAPNRVYQCHKCGSPANTTDIQDDWYPSPLQITTGIHLFFHHVVHAFPFLHEPTFNPSSTPDHLVLSMACLGYQYGEDPDDGAPGSGEKLSLKCFKAARELVAQNEEAGNDSTHRLVMVQAYLLLQVYAMMYLAGSGCEDGLRMHSEMIRLSRSSGLMQSLPTNPTATSDLDSLWREFVKAESHKRTMLALHHMDALWYQLLSVPRSISHLEIKHDMPCHDSLWTVASSSEWAHRTLIANRSAPPIRYNEAIRRFLEQNPAPGSAPQLELQGALNVIHFLQTSLREVSGWSAMTGHVSPERFEALTACLTAMEPYIRSRTRTASQAQCIVVEATWEMAMLEKLSWSASHMGGVVEVSVDAALATAACLAASSGFILEPEIARSLQRHVDWFLVYLDNTLEPDREPPFVTVYAFKAFLVAWQLFLRNAPNVLAVVGIADGDTESALAWAKKVFKRRQKWKVGKLVLQNLGSLAESTGAL